jgi:hypothetical protein
MREAQLSEEVSSLQALADEYKRQYDRSVEENARLRAGGGDASTVE